jgi:hypothetical protein
MSRTVEAFAETKDVNFTMQVVPAKSGLDLTTVTGATAALTRGDGTVFNWTNLALGAATPTTLDIVRLLADTDFPEPDLIRAHVFLQVGAGGSKRAKPFHIHVLPFPPEPAP